MMYTKSTANDHSGQCHTVKYTNYNNFVAVTNAMWKGDKPS